MPVSTSPASSYMEFNNLGHNVKLKESAPLILLSQPCLYRPSSSGVTYPMSHLPHAGLPTSLLTMPPLRKHNTFVVDASIAPRLSHNARDSSLDPGKIVCDKCGLYERTLPRPRLLQFDELQTGNESRQQSKSISDSPVPKLVKKEVERQTMSRRVSVPSSSSSVHNSSDWDDSGSMPSIFMSICGIDSAYGLCLFLWFRNYLVFRLARHN